MFCIVQNKQWKIQADLLFQFIVQFKVFSWQNFEHFKVLFLFVKKKSNSTKSEIETSK